MGAIHGEDAELRLLRGVLAFEADKDARVCGCAVPRLPQRIFESDHPRLVERKRFDRAEFDPFHFRPRRADEVSHERQAGDRGGRRTGRVRQPAEKRTAAWKQVERRW